MCKLSGYEIDEIVRKHCAPGGGHRNSAAVREALDVQRERLVAELEGVAGNIKSNDAAVELWRLAQRFKNI